jgi:hypothetical protein
MSCNRRAAVRPAPTRDLNAVADDAGVWRKFTAPFAAVDSPTEALVESAGAPIFCHDLERCRPRPAFTPDIQSLQEQRFAQAASPTFRNHKQMLKRGRLHQCRSRDRPIDRGDNQSRARAALECEFVPVAADYGIWKGEAIGRKDVGIGHEGRSSVRAIERFPIPRDSFAECE